MRKRSISVNGHQTSISLEDEFWQELAAIARLRKVSLNALVTEVDKQRADGNLSSTLRIFALKQAKRKISRA